jgi:acyl carrier protein
VEIWRQVLQLNKWVKRQLFNSGGDSIKAIALISAINNEFHANLKIVDLYINQTCESLSFEIERRRRLPGR